MVTSEFWNAIHMLICMQMSMKKCMPNVCKNVFLLESNWSLGFKNNSWMREIYLKTKSNECVSLRHVLTI